MNKNAIIAILIVIILAGVSLFAFNISSTVSYLAIGMVVVSFIALLVVTRKRNR